MIQQQYKLSLAASHHIQSFNYIYREGLQRILQHFTPMQINNDDFPIQSANCKIINPPFKNFKLGFESINIGKPVTHLQSSLIPQLFPQECRLAGITYTAPLFCELTREIDGSIDSFPANLGDIPIMVRSQNCHLYGLSEEELIAAHEDKNQFGGYFIINGNEKIIRMLIVQKSNYPVAFLRSSYANRGPGYTQYAVQMRCVRDDLYAKTFTLHYLSDGNINLRILYRKQQFLIPLVVILKAIDDFSDRQIYTRLMKGDYNNADRSDKIEVMIKTGRSLGLYSNQQFLEYIGKNFRLLLGVSTNYSDRKAGEIFLSQNVCPHIGNPRQKFDTLCLMVDKLYDLVSGDIQPENLDSMAVHEVLLPGHLYLMILREKLEEILGYLKAKMIKDVTANTGSKVITLEYLQKNLEAGMIGKSLEYFLSTGNIKSRTGLDLMQDKGFCVLADRLNNMRFLSHFRSIHRGAYFAQMKTTTVRKLLPECWGFLCPVHTPDGSLCGLLNHITISCRPLATSHYNPEQHADIQKLCRNYGMLQLAHFNYIKSINCYPVMVQGKHVGYVHQEDAINFVNALKRLKVLGKGLPNSTEVAFLKKGRFKNTIFPMIFITTATARFLRPVQYRPQNKVEWISPLEQISIDIDMDDSDYNQLSTDNVLSILPQHIPFLNYNQSPRNMYQCQMAKQTMGTSVLNWDYRFDNKLYRILQSQRPLVKSKHYQEYNFHQYNSGNNAVVAVISYTGYDMEDAMIINKSSYQNGFGHGCIYKSVEFLLNKDEKKRGLRFKMLKDAPQEAIRLFQFPHGIQADGLCKVGTRLKKFSPMLVVYQVAKEQFKTFYNKESEACCVESAIIVSGDKIMERVVIKLRFDRRPVIGDKFSSRHGQKGVLSMLYPKIDMPFTETGITPDIIINPNAFPSRMTIGMLIESMAAKSAALEGSQVNYQSFEAYQNDNVIDYFGKKLHEKGFNYYGNETMYSGIYGTQLKVDIFIGIVYYQRLRHMVHDKSQARSTGPVDILTQQPLKGRKKGGGIRIGQMQRDAMLAHGLSQVINQRLYKSSDKSEAFICNKCGLMISCYKRISKISGQSLKEVYKQQTICTSCNNKDCSLVGVPYVLKYLINQLAAMNIKLRFKLCV